MLDWRQGDVFARNMLIYVLVCWRGCVAEFQGFSLFQQKLVDLRFNTFKIFSLGMSAHLLIPNTSALFA